MFISKRNQWKMSWKSKLFLVITIKNQRIYLLKSKLIIYLNLKYLNIKIQSCFFPQKNQKRISLLFIRLSPIFLSKKQVLMKWRSEKVRETSVSYTEIVWLDMDNNFCMRCCLSVVLKKQSRQCLLTLEAAIYGQIKEYWLSVGSTLGSTLEASKLRLHGLV